MKSTDDITQNELYSLFICFSNCSSVKITKKSMRINEIEIKLMANQTDACVSKKYSPEPARIKSATDGIPSYFMSKISIQMIIFCVRINAYFGVAKCVPLTNCVFYVANMAGLW